MTWTKLSDGWSRHPKIIGLSRNARLLWVDGLTYCNEQLTDGFIPLCAVTQMLAGVGCKAHASVIEELCKANVWQMHSSGEGYLVHDFLDYNPSKCIVLQRRADEAKKKAKARSARGLSPRDTPRESLGESPRESLGESPRESLGESVLPVPSRPVPNTPTECPPVFKTPPAPAGDGSSTEKTQQQKKTKRELISLPADWKPTEHHAEIATSLHRDLEREADQFRDSALANSRRYADWNAAFGNWLRNENYRHPSMPFGNRPKNAYAVQTAGKGFATVQACLDRQHANSTEKKTNGKQDF